jgi:uroporphyrinogen decarboxylase
VKAQPDFEGFLRVVVKRQGQVAGVGTPGLQHVRLAEFGIDWGVMEAIQGPPTGDSREAVASWLAKFWREIGYDYVTQGVDLSFPHGELRAPDTATLSRGERSWVNEAKGPITNWEEFEKYPWPEVTPAAFEGLEAMGRNLPEGMKVAASIPGGPLENVTFLMGFETFSYALVDSPELVAAIAERLDETLCRVVEATSSMDWVGAQWINDDMGFKNSTLASPAALRKYVFPTQKRMAEIAHRNGKPVFLHSCGKLDDIMDELIDDVGIDAKHSFEDVIMPVWEAKRKWGDRIGRLGGVDMDVLARGSEEDVRAYTRRCIDECLAGGGWALGSGNTIANYVPVANFMAMVDEGRRAGA